MDKKVYVSGMDNEQIEGAVVAAVKALAGVSACSASSAKAQVMVTFDDSVAGIEDAVSRAICSTGIEVLN